MRYWAWQQHPWPWEWFFVVEGLSKANYIKEQMRAEQVTLAALGLDGAMGDNVIDSAGEAEHVAEVVKEHRLSIASTYADLMAMSPSWRYDPGVREDLTYSQALKLENYLYLGVAGLGLTTVTIVSGTSMIVTGLALGLIGFAVWRVAGKVPATSQVQGQDPW